MNELIRSQFFEYLNKFLIELGKSSKKIKKIIDSDYNDIKDDKYMDCIKQNIFIHKENFLGKEDELDDFFKNNSIELLENINLSDIWKKSEKDNKNAIIQYLKVFVFMFESANNVIDKTTDGSDSESGSGSEKLEDETNKNETDEKNETVDDKFEQLLKESLLNNNQNMNENMNENMNSFYDSMKDTDNSIIGLAKNIAEDLKNESGGDPNNLMNMFNNGNGINGLISSITSKLDSQIKSGNLDQNKLLGDAQKMMGNNKNLFGDLFKSMNPQNTKMPTSNQSSTQDVKIEETTDKKKVTKKKNTKKNGSKKK